MTFSLQRLLLPLLAVATIASAKPQPYLEPRDGSTCSAQVLQYNACPPSTSAPGSWSSVGCFSGYVPGGGRIFPAANNLEECLAVCDGWDFAGWRALDTNNQKCGCYTGDFVWDGPWSGCVGSNRAIYKHEPGAANAALPVPQTCSIELLKYGSCPPVVNVPGDWNVLGCYSGYRPGATAVFPPASSKEECLNACLPYAQMGWNENVSSNRCGCYSADYLWQSPWSGCSKSSAIYTHVPGTGIPPPAPSSTSLELPAASSTPSATPSPPSASIGCSAEVLSTKSCPPSVNEAGAWTPFGCFAAYSAFGNDNSMPSASTEAECFSACKPFFYASWNELNKESRCQCFDAGWTFVHSQYGCEDGGVRRLYTHTPGDDSPATPTEPTLPEVPASPSTSIVPAEPKPSPPATESTCSALVLQYNACPPSTSAPGSWSATGCFSGYVPGGGSLYPAADNLEACLAVCDGWDYTGWAPSDSNNQKCGCFSGDFVWDGPWQGCNGVNRAVYKHEPGAANAALPVPQTCSIELLKFGSCPPVVDVPGEWEVSGCFSGYMPGSTAVFPPASSKEECLNACLPYAQMGWNELSPSNRCGCYSADYAWQSPWYGCSSKYSTALYKHAPGTGIPSPAPSSTSLELPSASSTPSATTPASPVSTGCSAEVLLNKSCPPSSLNGAGGWTPFGCFAAYSAAGSDNSMPSASTEAECFSACTPFFYASWNEVNTESRCQCFDAGWTFSQSQYSCEDPGVRRLYTHTPGDDSAGSLPPSPPATPEIAETPVLTECSAESISTNSCPPPTDGAGGWNPIGCFGRITPNVDPAGKYLFPEVPNQAECFAACTSFAQASYNELASIKCQCYDSTWSWSLPDLGCTDSYLRRVYTHTPGDDSPATLPSTPTVPTSTEVPALPSSSIVPSEPGSSLTATTTEPEPSASTTVEPETPSSTALPESEPSSVESPASSTVEPTPSATDAPETPSVPPVCTTPGVGSCPTPAGNFAPVGCYGSDSVLFDLAVASTGTQLGQLIDLVTCMAFCSSSSFSAFVPAAVSDKSCFCFSANPLSATAAPKTCSLASRKRDASTVSIFYQEGASNQGGSASTSATRQRRLARARAARRQQLAMLKHSLCPVSDQLACKVSSFGSGFECIDVQLEVESCGGCLHGQYGTAELAGPGVDCLALPGVDPLAVSCTNGKCVVEGCSPGHALALGQCIRA